MRTAYAYHFNDSGSSATSGTVTTAQLGNYAPDGLGVRFGTDPSDTTGTNGAGGNDTTGTHQIDNVGGGIDFIALQFDQVVTLTDITRAVFDTNGKRDDDAMVYGFTSASAYGSLALANTYNYSQFTQAPGSGPSGSPGTDPYNFGAGLTGNVFLVAASNTDRDDGFKLAGVKVNYTPSVTPSVPEPATWAMMIVGFGAVGASLRRSRLAVRTAAA